MGSRPNVSGQPPGFGLCQPPCCAGTAGISRIVFKAHEGVGTNRLISGMECTWSPRDPFRMVGHDPGNDQPFLRVLRETPGRGSSCGRLAFKGNLNEVCVITMWLWVDTVLGSHVGGLVHILEPILVGTGMFSPGVRGFDPWPSMFLDWDFRWSSVRTYSCSKACHLAGAIPRFLFKV